MEDINVDALLRTLLTNPETGLTSDEDTFVKRILAAVPQDGAQCVFASLEKDGTLSYLTTGSTTAGSINVCALIIHRLTASERTP